jgi:hypothetical protein
MLFKPPPKEIHRHESHRPSARSRKIWKERTRHFDNSMSAQDSVVRSRHSDDTSPFYPDGMKPNLVPRELGQMSASITKWQQRESLWTYLSLVLEHVCLWNTNLSRTTFNNAAKAGRYQSNTPFAEYVADSVEQAQFWTQPTST